MNKEEIYRIIDDETRWTSLSSDPELEFSELVAVWDDNVSFMIYGTRKINDHSKCQYNIIQSFPQLVLIDNIDDMGIDWNDNELKLMRADEIINDVAIHSDFLKRQVER